ncbi:valine--tRNA ligase [Candidatus Uhrbacteria bacterium]|nr:valine--tRNA ligase [Candidatus Uhrbacteria bacterium]
MAEIQDLPKAYEASAIEDKMYAEWEASGVFNPDKLPDRNQKGEPYCIMMPPPNRTGTLHMGHAMGMAVQDLLIRFERMRGKRALWVPGTDHAAIATQVKVEQLLIKEGMKDPRKELGREKFLERVVQFADESRNTIVNQTRKMGSSCDWSRERYTFDKERNAAVYQLFKMMYEDGLIERGYRIVNWDPQFQTTLSDDEVLTKDVTTKLLTFTYDKDFPIAISTTRPESKFGDTAVAVHPNDDRYKKFIGQTFEPVFCGKKLSIKIVGDEAVDPAFGTGALGVTPAHSMIDADIAQRHNLKTIPVIGKDAKMLPECGPDFAGLSIEETRAKVEKMLGEAGLLKSVEEVQQALPIAERGGAAVEQLPMEQWFVRVNKPFTLRQDTLRKPSDSFLGKLFGMGSGWKKGEQVTLKQLMMTAVESGQTRIIPEQFEKIYFHWINNLRDWCISRQIWFGHRVPVWYRKGVVASEAKQSGPSADSSEIATSPSAPRNDEYVVSDISPGPEWEQDPDTLDTWFSSGSWTFSALGWPNEEEWAKHRAYHPTSVLETGKDILFFWIARMVLMSTYALGEVPFKDAYLHGLVRDEQGRKMSKSLGNILDPLELIPKYGTDAVRLSLLIGNTPGQDTKLSEQKIEGYRNFTNKLWNISRFILTVIASEAKQSGPSLNSSEIATSPSAPRNDEKTLADRWILARLSEVSSSVTKKLETYQFSAAGEELRDFTWGDLADWYLEIAKVEKGKSEILKTLLQSVLKMWHPFMPFVTEYVWGLAEFPGKLIVAEWPVPTVGAGLKPAPTEDFETLRTLVTDMRRLRAENGVEPAKKVEFVVTVGAYGNTPVPVEENTEWMSRLVNGSIAIVDAIPDGYVVTPSGKATIGLNLAGAVDLEKEKAKLTKELDQLKKYVTSTETKLANAEFTSKAPEKVIADMKAKLSEAQEKVKTIEERLQKS